MRELPRVLIADNLEIIRNSIAGILTDAECAEVVGTAADGYTAIKYCRNKNIDIVIIDLSLARPSGVETIRKIMSINPDLKLVVCSSEINAGEVFSLISEGVKGYIPKQARTLDFVAAIRSIHLGYAFLPECYIKNFVKLRQNSIKSGNMYGLSPREIEILDACVSGICTKEVASRFNISVRTVEAHRNAIYRKTHCNNIDSLYKIAAQLALPSAETIAMQL